MTQSLRYIIRTVEFDAPAADVWALVGDFFGINRWHPSVPPAEARPTGALNQPGSLRVFRAGTSEEVIERIVRHDDQTRTIAYTLPEPPFPATDYEAQIVVTPIWNARTHIMWSSSFRADEQTAAALETSVGDGLYGAGLEALSVRKW